MHIVPLILLLSVKVNVPLTLMLFGPTPFKPSTATYRKISQVMLQCCQLHLIHRLYCGTACGHRLILCGAGVRWGIRGVPRSGAAQWGPAWHFGGVSGELREPGSTSAVRCGISTNRIGAVLLNNNTSLKELTNCLRQLAMSAGLHWN